MTAFHRIIKAVADAEKIDITLVDVGPNVGAMNRAALVAADQVVIPLGEDPGTVFAGWGGACTGAGACVVTLSAAQDVTATFDLAAVFDLAGAAGYVLGIQASPSAPTDASAATGATRVPMLAFDLTGSRNGELVSIVLGAHAGQLDDLGSSGSRRERYDKGIGGGKV